MANPDFRGALEEIVPGEQATCLQCHAPTTVVTGDYAVAKPITEEGITCDFCHSLKGVDLGRKIPFDLDVGDTKRGPFRNTAVAPHKTAYSELHISPELCASCHEYRNAHGVDVLSTYSEWQAGPYPDRGVPCQGCHMAIYQGKMVATQETDEISRTFINLHAVPGGRSVSQLRRAFDLDIGEINTEGSRTSVIVMVTNQAAGHKVPTGFSNRRVKLEVTVPVRERSQTQVRVYERVLNDNRGKRIRTVARLFTDAVGERSDSRIAPGVTRKERFVFPKLAKGASVVARLVYEVDPETREDRGRETEIWLVNETVP
jgi:hypothetical protein